MDTRLKLLALACVAPLALAACEQEATEEAQVGQAEPPAAEEPAGEPQVAEEPAAGDEVAGVTQETEETQSAQMPEETAEAPAAGEPTAETEVVQVPVQEPGGAAPAQGGAEFTGNWAMQGEGCPGEWEFSEQTIEIPEQGSFEVQNVQQNGQEVELEVAGMEGGQTQTLTLEFPDPQQQDTMIVRGGGEEVTLERCQ